MPKAHQSTAETLFHHWRRGDATAGKAMAQRFTDWYYAIAISRLGESQGETPFRSACASFSKGVVKVDDTRRLLGWAHNIARKQLHTQVDGGRISDGDLPNAFTRKKPPKALLASAREALPSQMDLLETTYGGRIVPEDLYSVLKARYEVKSWLRDHMDVPFKVTPRTVDADRVPLTLYEAGRLTGDSEDSRFELYMLNDQEICQDVAEFAHYAIALRGGVGHAKPVPNQKTSTPAPRPPQAMQSITPGPAPKSEVPVQAAPADAASKTPMFIGLAVAVVVAIGIGFALFTQGG